MTRRIGPLVFASLAIASVVFWIAGSCHLAAAVELANLPSSEGTDVPAAVAAVVELSLERSAAEEDAIVLTGPDARRQFVVLGRTESGDLIDMTSRVGYELADEGVISIDEMGFAVPLGDGETTLVARVADGPTVSHQVRVDRFGGEVPIHFPSQITPIFTKLACNSGGCHGKASGQNGFRLSLLGFEADDDYEFLVKESFGRRLFPAAPEQSLLLLKATNEVPHGGGAKLSRDSHEYRLLRRWIAQGMPYGDPEARRVDHIEVLPRRRTMTRQDTQQVSVIAHYSDGSLEDVTRVALFESNDAEMAEADKLGRVSTMDLTGEVTVMARYQGQVDVFRASIPLGVEITEWPEPANFVDEHVFAKLKTLGVPTSDVADDSSFLRRSAIDIAGRLPTREETTALLADTSPEKRARWIDTLLNSSAYADFFANKWSSVLRNKREDDTYKRGTFAFHSWIRESLHANKPYNEFVGEILAATGEVGDNPPVNWYREVKDMNQQVEDTAQLFLGLRIQCARCHHHPFEKWSQRDYYGFAAFFSRVGRKPGATEAEQRIFHNEGQAFAQHPRSGEQVPPAGLGAEAAELEPVDDPRQVLVDWMTDPSNEFFAKAVVNRYWKHFFSRGLVDPEDDMRVTNPPANPELLDALAAHFVESGYDLKDLVRTICNSTTYQLASEPNEHNVTDKQNFSRYYPKRLAAEVLLDSLNDVTQSTTSFAGLPAGTLAVQLPDQASKTYFLTVFGSPQSETACECERSQEANLAQSLHLLNSAEVQEKLAHDGGRASTMAADEARSVDDKIRDLYLSAFARNPDGEELAIARGHVEKSEQPRQAYEDIIWALVNTKEFLFNH
jgi:hypothetical protein